MLLLLLNYVVLRALWKIDVHLISTLVNKSRFHPSIHYHDFFWFAMSQLPIDSSYVGGCCVSVGCTNIVLDGPALWRNGSVCSFGRVRVAVKDDGKWGNPI